MSLYIVFCTFPDKDTAQRLAGELVEAGVAACVNLLPGAQSIYRWQGKVESAQEVLAIMKTTADAYPQLEAKLKALHPYEVPEIMAVPVERAERAYATWVEEVTTGKIRMTNDE